MTTILPEGDSEECPFEYSSVIENHHEIYKIKVTGCDAYLKFVRYKTQEQMKKALAIQNLLAEEQYAPRILRSSRGHQLVQYLPVGYAMVIEESLEDFLSCADFILDKENIHLIEGFMSQVKEKVIGYLGAKNIVHGDLRFTNILISKQAQLEYKASRTIPEGGLRLVDFEFSGYEGTNYELGKLVSPCFYKEIYSEGMRMKKNDMYMINKDFNLGISMLRERESERKTSSERKRKSGRKRNSGRKKNRLSQSSSRKTKKYE
jgi:serine/threonine protein kinase